MNLYSKIESYLFYKGEPVTLQELSQVFEVSPDQIRTEIGELRAARAQTGIVVVESANEITLGTHPEFSEFFTRMRKEELEKELSKASLETLAIILYKNGVTRSEIDYIRGVNSTFILRNLLMRGLIDKVEHPSDNRKLVYRPSLQLLTHLGITSITELPHVDELRNKIAEVLEKSAEAGSLTDESSAHNEEHTTI